MLVHPKLKTTGQFSIKVMSRLQGLNLKEKFSFMLGRYLKLKRLQVWRLSLSKFCTYRYSELKR